MTVLRGILAVGAGVLLAAVTGILVDLANGHFGWIAPKYGYMYVYPWLTALGGLLAGGLAAGCFAAWNRGGTLKLVPSPQYAARAAGAGLLWATLAGILFDYANGNFGWVTPANSYPYIYAWLIMLGGVVAAVVAVSNYTSWQLTAPPAGKASSGVKSSSAAKATGSSKASGSGSPGFTSARQQASGFADVPGMPLDDFKSALTPGDKVKE